MFIEQMIKTILHDTQPTVLAIIVNVEGSAYRKVGAWMFIQADGTQHGVISGGCIENDLQERAKQLFKTGKTALVDYDLSSEDDLGWGRGAGCNGVVTILIRDIDSDFRKFLTTMLKKLQTREPFYYIQSLDKQNDYAVSNMEEISWNTNYINKVGQRVTLQKEIEYFQLIWPQPKLFIIGAGVDAQSLAQLAIHVGYTVHLIDRNRGISHEKYFPKKVSFHTGDVIRIIKNISFTHLDTVIVMTHDFDLDKQLLQHIHYKELLYFGILGSKRRTERLFQGDIPKEVHSPVGLPIHAEGPEEIAVSIVAELIAKRRGN